jgi:hypothetical protein
VAKRGERRPWTVRFRFEDGREWARGTYTSRDAAEFAAQQQRETVGPNGETCEAWVVDRRPAGAR